ncbi:hypothetical protein GCM10022403_055300 [Streptomyces coacervatus]|uniref:Integral membrane protein n=1 Tax=Streptomyces coacervatus TaxID=647381 RepID=A0ABP7IBZ9_9ACTN|nr:hypothetical protein [Streptomyces coacervatus]MDF2269105.1 hypothetical protein [Streptomyces coacervatus]
MVRYVHHELSAAALILAGVAGGWAAAVATGQSPPVRSGAVGVLVTSALGFLVLSTLVRASRLKWVGQMREFEAATPVPDTDGRHLRTVLAPRTLGLLLLPALCVFVIRDTGIVVVPLALGLDWLGKALVGASWERMNGRRLWLTPGPDEPSGLRYTTVSPSRGTRTATGARPA